MMTDMGLIYRVMSFAALAFSDTHCVYARRDGIGLHVESTIIISVKTNTAHVLFYCFRQAMGFDFVLYNP